MRLRAISAWFSRQKKYDEAERLLLAAYDGMRFRQQTQTRAGRIPMILTLKALESLYAQTKQPQLAAKWRDRTAQADAYQYGSTQYHAGKYDQAIGKFTDAIRLDPKHAEAYFGRGACYAKQGEYDKAIADLTDAIRLDPSLAAAFYNRGSCWAYKQEYGKAIADYSEAIRIDPKLAAAYHDRAAIWELRGDQGKAIKDLSEAIRVNPKYAVAYIHRGTARSEMGEHDKASLTWT